MKCEQLLIDVNGMTSFECGCQVGYHLNRSNFQQCEGILLLRVHAQGVKQLVYLFVVVIVIGTKIARFHVLGICSCCTYLVCKSKVQCYQIAYGVPKA